MNCSAKHIVREVDERVHCAYRWQCHCSIYFPCIDNSRKVDRIFYFILFLFNYNLCFGLTLSGPVTWMRARCTMNSIQILDLKIKKISCTLFFPIFFLLPSPLRKSDSVLACKPFTNIVYSQFLNSFFVRCVHRWLHTVKRMNWGWMY